VAADSRPQALPPETRPVGQLVAETLRFYGGRFWAALPLGLVVAVADQLFRSASVGTRILVLLVCAPLFSLAYAAAAALVSGRRPSAATWLRAVVLGTVAFAPAAFVFPWFALLAIAWLAFVGLVVPVVAIEDAGWRGAFPRAFRLARADYVHALGSLATFAILFFLVRLLLALLLRDTGDQAERIAVFLADLVLSPLLFLGSALLYLDQAARLESRQSRDHDRKEP
jgi:hypothetical protein